MKYSCHTICVVALLLVGFWPANSRADGLPTFEDFRRVDRTRRLMGQLQTAELLDVTRMNSELLLRTARNNTNDYRIGWGAAELLVNWPDKRVLFEAALEASSTNVAIATRFACAAARQGEYELALKWTKYCRENDNDNTVPWLTELWIQGRRKQAQIFENKPPVWATSFHDYSIEATEARVLLLEKAGYSAYSARRLGFKPDSDALLIARELAKPPMEEVTQALLRETASYLQERRQFLLSEMVGQTIERTLYAMRPDADSSVTVRVRSEEIEKRRDDLKKLLGEIEHDVIDYATEKQMVQYFDDVMALGEEDAMKKLAMVVARPTPTPAPLPS